MKHRNKRRMEVLSKLSGKELSSSDYDEKESGEDSDTKEHEISEIKKKMSEVDEELDEMKSGDKDEEEEDGNGGEYDEKDSVSNPDDESSEDDENTTMKSRFNRIRNSLINSRRNKK